MQINRKKQFLIIFTAFVTLGASFKVMTLIEGFTEVRPVNAIPPVAGFICGPIGALACGMGNLFADFFGNFDSGSILGFAANFIAAYLPYRLWYLFSDEEPNLHKKKNILIYIMICLVNSFTTAWILSFGLYSFFNIWIEDIYIIVFFNNFVFSIVLGMPLLIILTSDSVSVKCTAQKYSLISEKKVLKKLIFIIYSLFMTLTFICVVILRLNPADSFHMRTLSALSLLGFICQIIQ